MEGGGSIAGPASTRPAVTYFIEAQREGRYFLCSTGVHEKNDALAEWTRFLDDPGAYQSRPARKAATTAKADPTALVLDDVLVNEYMVWCAEDGQSKAWRTKNRKLLSWWVKKLFKQNLRGLDKRHPRHAFRRNEPPRARARSPS